MHTCTPSPSAPTPHHNTRLHSTLHNQLQAQDAESEEYRAAKQDVLVMVEEKDRIIVALASMTAERDDALAEIARAQAQAVAEAQV